MAILFCFAACTNSSSAAYFGAIVSAATSEKDKDDSSNIDYSLGNPPAESKRIDKFSIEENSDGIYITFDIPEKTVHKRVYIERLGQVSENICYLNEDESKGCFFYPFVTSGKEYTIRFVFLRDEDKDNNGFTIDYVDGDGAVGWFQTKVTAGAKSKGEVRFTSKGKIDVKKNYDFRFTQKPTFQNEHLLTENGNDWKVEIGLVEGISWAHGDERKTKWYGQIEIPRATLTDTCNLFEMCPWVSGIDFVCVRPIMHYEHDGKTYKYQWDSFVQDIFYPPKADSLKTIDISNSSQVNKICGTWVFRTSWTNDDYQIYDSVVPMKINQTKTLTIDTQNLEIKIVEIVTKKDGGMFTEEEVKFHVDNSDRSTTTSDDKKALTQVWYERETLSEFVADWENDSYTRHYELKLFEDENLGSELRVIGSGKDNGQNYEFCDTYKKQ